METRAAISVQNLTKSFGSFAVLKGISFEVPTGQICGVLGPNGAGKTTLIKSLVGASRPSGGEVKILGNSPTNRAARKEIGYMPQAPALYEDLSALDNVLFFARAQGLKDAQKEAEEILEFVGLKDRQHDTVYTFSGGMKQRVSLACALVHHPKVLLLDEPTAGVDPKLKERFWEYFRKLAKQGVTILISTHLMDEALLCDYLTIIRGGQILASEKPQEIMAKGETELRIWQGEEKESAKVFHYTTALPSLLQAHGLDPKISKIEVQEEPLESIIVRMIGEDEV